MTRNFIISFGQLINRGHLVALLLCLSVSLKAEYKAEYLVVTHPSVTLESLTSLQLRQIYVLQKKRWKTGEKIKVFSFETVQPAYNQFVLSVLKIQPHQLTRLWKRLIFTGTGKAPVGVLNSKQMLSKIKETEDSIGYVEMNAELDLTGVKVLKIALK